MLQSNSHPPPRHRGPLRHWLQQHGLSLWMPMAPLTPMAPPALAATMLTHLQRHALRLQLILGTVAGTIFGISIAINTWVIPHYPPHLILLHPIRLGLGIALPLWLVRRQQVVAAWMTLVLIGMVGSWISVLTLGEPGLLLFDLFSFVGPAIVLPLRRTLQLLLVEVSAHLLFGVIDGTQPDVWLIVLMLFLFIVGWCLYYGVVIRRFIQTFATTVATMLEETTARARADQQLDDLTVHVTQIASLEHDVRQPLRAIQGFLTAITEEAPPVTDLTLPALGAAQRAERLINNLLDASRTTLRLPARMATPTPLVAIFDTLAAMVPGLAHYYTDPVIPVQFTISALPALTLDAEQCTRALLNLLDNALAVAPPGSLIAVRAWSAAGQVQIQISDQGPGMPVALVTALNAHDLPALRTQSGGLGLRQVLGFVLSSGAQLRIEPSPYGTTITCSFQCAEASNEPRVGA